MVGHVQRQARRPHRAGVAAERTAQQGGRSTGFSDVGGDDLTKAVDEAHQQSPGQVAVDDHMADVQQMYRCENRRLERVASVLEPFIERRRSAGDNLLDVMVSARLNAAVGVVPLKRMKRSTRHQEGACGARGKRRGEP